ncbi:VirD4-like conjugal transfer protein, CD1115 family [Siminovitchia sp. 179-K 8D1 HS]|uniref:VirD4-like conjugal transfer protein, CD1115 family n=1 Tax=Siminovitchia sp. 179-K 8D1 HS TaxID=3142385 RepID=UPI0039A1115D
MQDKQLLERLSSPKAIFLFAIGFLIVSFFLANFVLAFLQELLLAIEQFAKDPENAGFSIPWESFLYFQTDVLWFYAGFYLIVGIGLIKFLFNIRLNYQSLNKGQHGTSEFEKVKALKKQYKMIPAAKEEYDGNGGVIISGLQEKYRPYRLLIDEGPIHTMVIGITRSGKGETFVFPMLDVLSRAKNKPSLIVNDPKGELAAASYDTLVNRGYDVHVFNLIQQSMGMGFNPLQLVVDAWKNGNPSLSQQYANSVAYSLYHDPNAKDPFWSNSAKSLVTAIILALTEDAVATGKEEKVNMYSVANFLSTKGSDNDEEGNNALDLFFRARDDNNPARMMYATSNFAAGNTRASIFSTAMDKLQIFTLEPNAKLTSYNSMNLTDAGFGDKPVVVFMVTPDFDESNHVLASIFVSQLYRVNAEKATMSPSGKMKRHVHFLLDEFGNMPTVEGMSGMVTVGAGRGFRFHLIVQAYSQIKSRYGDEADTIIGNCSNQIYILTKDEQTAKQFSSLIGTKTITDISRNGKLLSSDKSHSESVKERPLIMPDELMQLKEGQSVVVRANKRQDNKRRKIAPKPIFNKDVTSHKFRWEYLADDFDNSRSILDLPIMSTTYYDLNLSHMVFTSKNEQEQFVRMVDAMGKADFLKLKTDLRKVFIACGESFKYKDEIEKWSFLHLLSYLTYETSLSGSIIYKIFKSLRQYLPDTVLEKWDQKIREVREKQEQQRCEQEESIGETGEPMELDEKEALRKQVKGAV